MPVSRSCKFDVNRILLSRQGWSVRNQGAGMRKSATNQARGSDWPSGDVHLLHQVERDALRADCAAASTDQLRHSPVLNSSVL